VEARREIEMLSRKLEEKAMSPGGSIVSSDIIIVKVRFLIPSSYFIQNQALIKLELKYNTSRRTSVRRIV